MTLPFAPKTPVYGGDYNPEQWDAGTVDEDIRLMREAGVNLVSLGIFSWARMEPEEGRYELDWLAELIDKLYANGIMVDLATGTASPPAWMAEKHPETLPVTAEGIRFGFGSRQQYCPSSPLYRRKAAELAGELAQRFGAHPGVVLWHIGNEYGCHIHECFCEECAAQFRIWLLEKHGSVDGINKVWGTDFWSQRYGTIDQITPPRAMPTFSNPGQMLDWRRFCNHQILGCLLGEREQIRKYSDRPVTTNFMGAFRWLDYREWARYMDVITDDSYPEPSDPASACEVAWQADLMRGLAGGKPWFLMEQTTSEVQWRTRNASKRPGQYALWSLERLAHGADGVLQFQWRQSIRGSETFHAGMVPHAGKKSATWHEVVELGSTLQKLGPVVGAPQEANVAIVLDWESEWATMSAVGPQDWSHFRLAREWHRTLWEQGITTDIVGTDADLSRYTVVIVPGVLIDYREFAQRASRAVERGTQLLVVTPTGLVTPELEALQGGYLGSLQALLGVSVTDLYGLTAGVYEHDPMGVPRVHTEESDARDNLVNRLSRAVEVPGAAHSMPLAIDRDELERARDRLMAVDSPKVSLRPGLRGQLWGERVAMVQPDVEVFATFAASGGAIDVAGLPALTRRAVGAGAAWYLATDADGFTRAVIWQLLAAYARVHPAFAGLPDGVEAQERGDFLFLLNHSDRVAELAGIMGKDLVSGGEATGHLVLPPRSGAVIDRR
ncbi:MAG: beta-galactosidase [Ancrocorticia sp.]|jgi:beta-galactosidase|nr:beta-galactosidase [Ancrocorticia sp.]MCI1932486.1 beta-galactosidase [Ancrocorticia sp.]MCI2029346.1 beta-galactosidase [Ancrocorticia sp.]MCI2178395.1 beta-galactosidase [Ancrocorticia sp.]